MPAPACRAPRRSPAGRSSARSHSSIPRSASARGRGQPRFRLCHVGARHLADREAILRLPQLLLQHLDVAALQVEDRRVTNEVHVGGRGSEQHGLLGQPQRFARRRHLLLGLAGARGGTEAVEQRLRVGERRRSGQRYDRCPRIADGAGGEVDFVVESIYCRRPRPKG